MVKYLLSRVILALAIAMWPLLVFAATLEWDRNTEPDMKDYQVWACFTPACVVVKTQANLQATIPQVTTGATPSWPIPVGREGAVAVSARDESLNESGLSVQVPFDTAAPTVPANPRRMP